MTDEPVLNSSVQSDSLYHQALAYHRRGWCPTPVKARDKKAILKDWPKRELSGAEIHKYFSTPGVNVGILLGEGHGQLIDVDLDAAEALALADWFLPETPCAFGRASKRR